MQKLGLMQDTGPHFHLDVKKNCVFRYKLCNREMNI